MVVTPQFAQFFLVSLVGEAELVSEQDQVPRRDAAPTLDQQRYADWLVSMSLAASPCEIPALSIMCAISFPSSSFLAVRTVAGIDADLQVKRDRRGVRYRQADSLLDGLFDLDSMIMTRSTPEHQTAH
ncbi:hypothetical protein [Saccharopolyspora sp. 5N708]|uniref:hypothetical protein n=1 Tax=Saccharopolyspora sp. 5N708 TaxID=3457424 RepID=UPI003FD064AD